MDKPLMSARTMDLSPSMVTLLLHLDLTSNLLSNNLRTDMLLQLATPRVRSHSSLVILGMVPDKDTHLELLNHTVHLPLNLHDLLILSNNHNLSFSRNRNRSCNLSLSPSPSPSLSPKLTSSNSIITRSKSHKLPSLRDKVNLVQSNPVLRTSMILRSRTRIQTFKHGPNTMLKEAKTPRVLSTSSQCLG